jgi:hypothetical protein
MMGGVLLTGKAMRQPQWTYGMILRRNSARVMFVRFDKDRQRMMGGGVAQWVGIRLDNNDRTNPQFNKVGEEGNYAGSWGWKLDDE